MRCFLAISVMFVLGGCASTEPNGPFPNDPFYAPIIPDIPDRKLEQDGSLYSPTSSAALYSDAKARHIGDIITIVLRENTTATKSASTSTSRETDVELDPILGLGGNVINLGRGNGAGIQFDLESESEFEGDAQANQSNSLIGNISVTVINVLPNGNMVVRGEKWLTLNAGDEYIRLAGIVRPQDISPANEVDSTRLANARIQYSGTGTFANAQKQGWLSKFFSSPYWPF